jgi:hypothetical protein
MIDTGQREECCDRASRYALSMSPVPVSGLINEQRDGDEEMGTNSRNIATRNIHGVFSEPDIEKRHRAIARLWAEDGVFIDPDIRYQGHSGVTLAADGVVSGNITEDCTNCSRVLVKNWDDELLAARCKGNNTDSPSPLLSTRLRTPYCAAGQQQR